MTAFYMLCYTTAERKPLLYKTVNFRLINQFFFLFFSFFSCYSVRKTIVETRTVRDKMKNGFAT